jgi:rSAM/selenodomain-associated transferase 1
MTAANTPAGAPARVLGLFAKLPAPGAAKTRLGPGPTPDWGACVADAFLRDALDRLSAVGARRVLAFAPAGAAAAFAELAAGRFEPAPQCDGDLGRRMADFIARRIAEGAEAVVLVGADSPTLPVEYVGRAFDELDRADVVLGPALDGGYYLIGCGRRLPPVFDGVSWGTGRVLAETVARLADPAWRLALLPPWYDVDTPADWRLLCGHLAALRRAGIDPAAPRTEALVRAYG